MNTILVIIIFREKMSKLVFSVVFLLLIFNVVNAKILNKRKCPEVRAVPHFDLPQVSSCLLIIKIARILKYYCYIVVVNIVTIL